MKENRIIAETNRLILRSYQKNDLNDLYEYLSAPDVVKYEPYKPMTLPETEENLDWRISTDEMVAVERKSDHKMIGNVYLGKREFAALAFQNGIHRIYAECDPQNENSWQLLASLGFLREAHLSKNVYFWKDEDNHPIWKDTYIYARLSEQE